MIVNRRILSRAAMVLGAATFVAFLGLGSGCSDEIDKLTGDATAEGVEAGLNDVLAGTVEPLFTFLTVIPDLIPPPPVAQSSFGIGLTCPESTSVCQNGSFVCEVTGGGFSLTFTFSQCVVATEDVPLTLSGGLIVTPGSLARGLGSPPINLLLQGLVINGSSPMQGSGVVDEVACSYGINVTSDDALVEGTIIQCEADDYPTAESDLSILIDAVVLDITFNGSGTASASATSEGELIANCSINLDTISSSCSAP